MRFEFKILDDDGELLGCNWTTFSWDDFKDTGVEAIETELYSELRAIKRERADAAAAAEREAFWNTDDEDEERERSDFDEHNTHSYAYSGVR